MTNEEAQFIKDNWRFKDKAQEEAFMEPLTPENCGKKLLLVRDITNLTRRELAQIIGCSESTLSRIERGASLPTKDFLSRLTGLVTIGYYKYSRLTNSEKEKISEAIGASGGAAAGVGGALAAISASGLVPGLSAAGITSGLAAIGGSMLGGLAVVAVIPIATAAAGYGLVKGIKAICESNRLSCTAVDDKFEIRLSEIPD